MEYRINRKELKDDIKKVKFKLINNYGSDDKVVLKNSLEGMLCFDYILKCNYNYFSKIKDKGIFFNRVFIKDKRFLDYDYHYDSFINSMSYYDVKDELEEFYDLDKIKFKNINFSKFSPDSAVNICKSFYKNINNPIIEDIALEMLDNKDHMEFINYIPKQLGNMGGAFTSPGYIIINNNSNNFLNSEVSLSHEVSHKIESVLSPSKMAIKKYQVEWLPTAIEFLNLEFLHDNKEISDDEYNILKQNRFSFFDKAVEDAVVADRKYGVDIKDLLKVQSFIYGYVAALFLKEGKDINGDLLYNFMMDDNSFLKFYKENNEFAREEIKKIHKVYTK